MYKLVTYNMKRSANTFFFKKESQKKCVKVGRILFAPRDTRIHILCIYKDYRNAYKMGWLM